MENSIEVDYWVIYRDGTLTAPGSLTWDSKSREEEFVYPLFERKIPLGETFSELRSTFVDQLAELLFRAEHLDKILVPRGTPITGESIER